MGRAEQQYLNASIPHFPYYIGCDRENVKGKMVEGRGRQLVS